MHSLILKSLIFLSVTTLCGWGRIDYASLPQAQQFAYTMHQRYRMDTAQILHRLHQARHQPETLARYQGRHQVGATDFSWHRYRSKILVPESIALGKRFMRRYRPWLTRAAQRYHVAPAIITAFIRVESKFGMYGSEYPVWDSLVTLAFHRNRKQKFFRGELEKVLLLARKNHLDVRKIRGSFAGAMGCVQQVPSIQLQYGVDLNGDGRKDPNDMRDCIGSIAYFLHKHGWSDRRAILVSARHTGNGFLKLRSGYRSRYPMATLRRYGVTPVKALGASQAYYIRMRDGKRWDIYLGDRNYRIITRYNASKRYATTVALYAQAMGY